MSLLAVLIGSLTAVLLACVTAEARREREEVLAQTPEDLACGHHLALVSAVMQAASSRRDVKDVLDAVWQGAEEGCGCVCVWLACRDGDNGELLHARADDALGDQALAAVGACEAVRKARGELRQAATSLEADGMRALGNGLVAAGVRSVFAVPLLTEGAFGGIVAFLASTPRGFPAVDRTFLATLASVLALTIHQDKLRREATSEKRLREQMAEGSGALLIGINTDGQVSFCNTTCEETLGIRAEEVVGRSWRRVIAAQERQPALGSAIAEALDGAASTARVEHLVGGRDITIDWRFLPQAGAGAGKAAVLAAGSDLTERLRLQKQLVRSERLATIGRLVAEVAHELNNPLTTVLGLGELLHQRVAEPRSKEDLQRLVDQAGRCRDIVRNLLSVVREHTPRREPTSVNSLIGEAVSLLRYEFGVGNVAPVMLLDAGLPPVLVDRHQIHQVIVNLLTNAYQALQNVGGGTMHIRTWTEEDRVCIAIADDGPGIPDVVFERIFEPFVTSKPEDVGTGLGLSVSRDIIEQHGGAIAADNRPDGGAVFTISLPATNGSPVAADAGDVDEAAGVEEGKIAPGTARVLILDDEEPLRLLMAEILSLQGLEVDHTDDPHEALQLVIETDYDLIISDLRMPGLSGEDFYEGVCETRPDLADRVIFVTGDVASDSAYEFLTRVGNPTIEKPFTTGEFVSVVKRRLAAVTA